MTLELSKVSKLQPFPIKQHKGQQYFTNLDLKNTSNKKKNKPREQNRHDHYNKNILDVSLTEMTHDILNVQQMSKFSHYLITHKSQQL